MTSPTFFLETAKAYPRIPAGGHKSSGISQTLTPGSCWRQHNPPLTYQQLHHALMSP
uniref:Uncharacterized protein n=1 Tax=Geospiza parvula TaxID=87175 RepID=A0A8C3MFT7_GEOPR